MKNLKVISAYNINVDAVHTVDAALASKMASNLEGEPAMPGAISSLDDLASGLIHCMMRGSGAELLVQSQETASAIGIMVPWERRLGGNAGIMADVLAKLGAEPVLNAPALGPDLASLLHPGVRVPIDGGRRLAPPAGAATAVDTPVHYVLQFRRGERVEAPWGRFTIPSDDRFIASYDRVNGEMKTSREFDAYAAENIGDVSGALVSGFQLVPGEGFQKVFDSRVNQVRSWKEGNLRLYVHAEMGSFQRPDMMKYLLSSLPADSVGMNEVEAGLMVKEETGPEGVLQAAVEIRERFDLGRVCIHTKDFVTSAVRDIIAPDDEVEALSFGSGVAASVMETGQASPAPVGAPVKLEGRRAVQAFIRSGARPSGRGAWMVQGEGSLCIAPSIEVLHPRVTVGLGDTMTAATFFMELQRGVRI